MGNSIALALGRREWKKKEVVNNHFENIPADLQALEKSAKAIDVDVDGFLRSLTNAMNLTLDTLEQTETVVKCKSNLDINCFVEIMETVRIDNSIVDIFTSVWKTLYSVVLPYIDDDTTDVKALSLPGLIVYTTSRLDAERIRREEAEAERRRIVEERKTEYSSDVDAAISTLLQSKTQFVDKWNNAKMNYLEPFTLNLTSLEGLLEDRDMVDEDREMVDLLISDIKKFIANWFSPVWENRFLEFFEQVDCAVETLRQVDFEDDDFKVYIDCAESVKESINLTLLQSFTPEVDGIPLAERCDDIDEELAENARRRRKETASSYMVTVNGWMSTCKAEYLNKVYYPDEKLMSDLPVDFRPTSAFAIANSYTQNIIDLYNETFSTKCSGIEGDNSTYYCRFVMAKNVLDADPSANNLSILDNLYGLISNNVTDITSNYTNWTNAMSQYRLAVSNFIYIDDILNSRPDFTMDGVVEVNQKRIDKIQTEANPSIPPIDFRKYDQSLVAIGNESITSFVQHGNQMYDAAMVELESLKNLALANKSTKNVLQGYIDDYFSLEKELKEYYECVEYERGQLKIDNFRDKCVLEDPKYMVSEFKLATTRATFSEDALSEISEITYNYFNQLYNEAVVSKIQAIDYAMYLEDKSQDWAGILDRFSKYAYDFIDDILKLAVSRCENRLRALTAMVGEQIEGNEKFIANAKETYEETKVWEEYLNGEDVKAYVPTSQTKTVNDMWKYISTGYTEIEHNTDNLQKYIDTYLPEREEAFKKEIASLDSLKNDIEGNPTFLASMMTSINDVVVSCEDIYRQVADEIQTQLCENAPSVVANWELSTEYKAEIEKLYLSTLENIDLRRALIDAGDIIARIYGCPYDRVDDGPVFNVETIMATWHYDMVQLITFPRTMSSHILQAITKEELGKLMPNDWPEKVKRGVDAMPIYSGDKSWFTEFKGELRELLSLDAFAEHCSRYLDRFVERVVVNTAFMPQKGNIQSVLMTYPRAAGMITSSLFNEVTAIGSQNDLAYNIILGRMMREIGVIAPRYNIAEKADDLSLNVSDWKADDYLLGGRGYSCKFSIKRSETSEKSCSAEFTSYGNRINSSMYAREIVVEITKQPFNLENVDVKTATFINPNPEFDTLFTSSTPIIVYKHGCNVGSSTVDNTTPSIFEEGTYMWAGEIIGGYIDKIKREAQKAINSCSDSKWKVTFPLEEFSWGKPYTKLLRRNIDVYSIFDKW